MSTPVEQTIAVWFTSTVLGFTALGCTENSAANGDASVGSVTDGENKPDAQTGFVPEGEYDSVVDAESLKALGITTLVTDNCSDPSEGEGPEEQEWSFAVHQDQASYAAAHDRLRGFGSPPEVNFETHVVIEVYAGEWGGCGEYVELTGARDTGEKIEVDARYVAVCGGELFNLPYLFVQAPRTDKPYVVIQKDSRCPPCHANGTITLQCRDEETRRCTGPHPVCLMGTVRVLPPAAACALSETNKCPDYDACLVYGALPLNTEAGCWEQGFTLLDCTPLPERCLSSGECDIPLIGGIGCYIELATGKQFKSWDQDLNGHPGFRECTEQERSELLNLPDCD